MTGVYDLLRNVPLLRDLEDPALEQIARRLPERRFPAGARIFDEGALCPGFWIVKEGSVNVFQVSPEGRIHVLDTFRPGDLFALVPALDGGPYPASAEAREDAVLVLFPREELIEAMKAAPRTALAVAALCAGRSRRLSRKVASVALRGVRERVAAWLVEQAEARSPCAACGAPVVVPLEARHEEIARRLGTAREVFARMLRTLEEEGKITRSRGAIRIRDLPGLRAIAGMEARE